MIGRHGATGCAGRSARQYGSIRPPPTAVAAVTFLRLVLLLAIAASLLAVASPRAEPAAPANAANKVELRIEVYAFAGFHVLTNRTTIDASAGRYRITTEIDTRGIVSLFIDLNSLSETEGRLAGDTVLPERLRQRCAAQWRRSPLPHRLAPRRAARERMGAAGDDMAESDPAREARRHRRSADRILHRRAPAARRAAAAISSFRCSTGAAATICASGMPRPTIRLPAEPDITGRTHPCLRREPRRRRRFSGQSGSLRGYLSEGQAVVRRALDPPAGWSRCRSITIPSSAS